MPIYEYQCGACGHRFERIQKFSDPAQSECPNCGQPVERLVSAPAIQFKGSGWYITDYAKKSSPDSAGKSSSKSPAKPAAEACSGEAPKGKPDKPSE